MFQVRLKGVSSKIVASRVFQGCFKGVSVGFKVFEKSSKGISGKFQMCFNGVLSGLYGCLKEAQCVFEEGLKGVSRMLRGIFKGVSREFQWISRYLKKVQREYQMCFNGVLSGL